MNETTEKVKFYGDIHKPYIEKVKEEIKLNKKLKRKLTTKTAIINDALRVRYF